VRAVLLGQGPKLTVEDLPPELWNPPQMRDTMPASTNAASPAMEQPVQSHGTHLRGALAEPERQIILKTLHDHHWNRSATADKLGINRTTLYKKMKRLGLDDPRLQYANSGK
jgi:DNA-binding NtrC family response regulator